MSQLKLQKNAKTLFATTEFWEIINEDNDSFYIYLEQPKWYSKVRKSFFDSEIWAIGDEAMIDLMNIIIIMNNDKTLTPTFWQKNIKKFPITLVKWLRKNLNEKPYGYEALRAISEYNAASESITSFGDTLVRETPTFDTGDLGRGWATPDEDLRSTFDFGSGDFGGGGAGGEY